MALMVLKTLEAMGPLHGYGIARRIEQISGDRLSLNYGSIYPALLRLCEQGLLEAQWRQADEPGKPPRHVYRLTRAGLAFARDQTVPPGEKAGVLLGAKA